MAIKNIMQFFQEVRFELRKVVWPSTQEWIGSTVVVLFLVFLFSVYLGVVDLLFSQAAKYIFKMYGGF